LRGVQWNTESWFEREFVECLKLLLEKALLRLDEVSSQEKIICLELLTAWLLFFLEKKIVEHSGFFYPISLDVSGSTIYVFFHPYF
jgi:hypothetical protein